KQGRPECFEGKRLWAAFGAFKHCKVKDVEVTSNFTEAVKFCQRELKQSKLPFLANAWAKLVRSIPSPTNRKPSTGKPHPPARRTSVQVLGMSFHDAMRQITAA